MFAFDFAGLEYVVGECGETGLGSQAKTDVGEPAQEQALPLADLREWRDQRGQVVAPVRPVRGLPDASVIAAVHAVIVRSNLRIDNVQISPKARLWSVAFLGLRLLSTQAELHNYALRRNKYLFFVG